MKKKDIMKKVSYMLADAKCRATGWQESKIISVSVVRVVITRIGKLRIIIKGLFFPSAGAATEYIFARQSGNRPLPEKDDCKDCGDWRTYTEANYCGNCGKILDLWDRQDIGN